MRAGSHGDRGEGTQACKDSSTTIKRGRLMPHFPTQRKVLISPEKQSEVSESRK